MEEIVKLRAEEAALLGFANYGELSLAAKMAETPQQWCLHARAGAARAPVRREGPGRVARVRAQGAGPFRAAFLGHVLREREAAEQRYAFSEQEGNSTSPRCGAAGMFRLVETLYGLRITRARRRSGMRTRISTTSAMPREAGRPVHLDMYARSSKPAGVDGRRDHAPSSGFRHPDAVAYLN